MPLADTGMHDALKIGSCHEHICTAACKAPLSLYSARAGSISLHSLSDQTHFAVPRHACTAKCLDTPTDNDCIYRLTRRPRCRPPGRTGSVVCAMRTNLGANVLPLLLYEPCVSFMLHPTPNHVRRSCCGPTSCSPPCQNQCAGRTRSRKLCRHCHCQCTIFATHKTELRCTNVFRKKLETDMVAVGKVVAALRAQPTSREIGRSGLATLRGHDAGQRASPASLFERRRAACAFEPLHKCVHSHIPWEIFAFRAQPERRSAP